MNTERAPALRAAVTAVLAAALALGLFVVPAWGENVQSTSPPAASLAIQAPGVLVAKGVAVDIDIEYMCLPGVFVDGISVEARERFGRRVAVGFGFVPSDELGPCDGTPQLVTVRLASFETPFKPGTALVTADLFGFDGSGFFAIADEQEIRLKNRRK